MSENFKRVTPHNFLIGPSTPRPTFRSPLPNNFGVDDVDDVVWYIRGPEWKSLYLQSYRGDGLVTPPTLEYTPISDSPVTLTETRFSYQHYLGFNRAIVKCDYDTSLLRFPIDTRSALDFYPFPLLELQTTTGWLTGSTFLGSQSELASASQSMWDNYTDTLQVTGQPLLSECLAPGHGKRAFALRWSPVILNDDLWNTPANNSTTEFLQFQDLNCLYMWFNCPVALSPSITSSAQHGTFFKYQSGTSQSPTSSWTVDFNSDLPQVARIKLNNTAARLTSSISTWVVNVSAGLFINNVSGEPNSAFTFTPVNKTCIYALEDTSYYPRLYNSTPDSEFTFMADEVSPEGYHQVIKPKIFGTSPNITAYWSLQDDPLPVNSSQDLGEFQKVTFKERRQSYTNYQYNHPLWKTTRMKWGGKSLVTINDYSGFAPPTVTQEELFTLYSPCASGSDAGITLRGLDGQFRIYNIDKNESTPWVAFAEPQSSLFYQVYEDAVIPSTLDIFKFNDVGDITDHWLETSRPINTRFLAKIEDGRPIPDWDVGDNVIILNAHNPGMKGKDGQHLFIHPQPLKRTDIVPSTTWNGDSYSESVVALRNGMVRVGSFRDFCASFDPFEDYTYQVLPSGFQDGIATLEVSVVGSTLYDDITDWNALTSNLYVNELSNPHYHVYSYNSTDEILDWSVGTGWDLIQTINYVVDFLNIVSIDGYSQYDNSSTYYLNDYVTYTETITSGSSVINKDRIFYCIDDDFGNGITGLNPIDNPSNWGEGIVSTYHTTCTLHNSNSVSYSGKKKALFSISVEGISFINQDFNFSSGSSYPYITVRVTGEPLNPHHISATGEGLEHEPGYISIYETEGTRSDLCS